MKKIVITFVLLFTVFELSAQVRVVCREVKMAKEPLPEVTYVEAIERRIGSKFEASEFNLREKPIVATQMHPMIECLYRAYSDHRPISISPDMIWLLILQGFSSHVNNNVEELRNKFVDFDGKKKLTIETNPISLDFIKGNCKSPWPLIFPLMADSISKYVKSDIHSLCVQSFSTTTYVEKATYEVVLFDIVSGYFEYEVASACEIPVIKIEGTRVDWLKIKNNLQKFKGYKIDYWINSLEPIIQEFVNAYDNKIDYSFWENIFKRKDESGGPYITGWIIKFFPYVHDWQHKMLKNPYIEKEPKEFMEGLTTNQFNNGLSKVDFIWDYFGTRYDMQFLAGFIGIKQNKKNMTLRPEIGWLVKEKKDIVIDKNEKSAKPEDNSTLKDVQQKNSNIPKEKKYLLLSFFGLLILVSIIIVFRKR